MAAPCDVTEAHDNNLFLSPCKLEDNTASVHAGSWNRGSEEAQNNGLNGDTERRVYFFWIIHVLNRLDAKATAWPPRRGFRGSCEWAQSWGKVRQPDVHADIWELSVSPSQKRLQAEKQRKVRHSFLVGTSWRAFSSPSGSFLRATRGQGSGVIFSGRWRSVIFLWSLIEGFYVLFLKEPKKETLQQKDTCEPRDESKFMWVRLILCWLLMSEKYANFFISYSINISNLTC